jgi:hypothetical protein
VCLLEILCAPVNPPLGGRIAANIANKGVSVIQYQALKRGSQRHIHSLSRQRVFHLPDKGNQRRVFSLLDNRGVHRPDRVMTS